MKNNSIETRFINICKHNGVEVKQYSELITFFDELGYSNAHYFSNGKIGVVKAIAANARDGNALIDASTLDKLNCLVDVDELFVLIDKDKIFETAYDAYKIANDSDYLLFIGAESKTADIEKQLISGVQGAKRVVFVLV